MKKQVFIIDTSAILSGKPIRFDNVSIFTTPAVSDELSPGGRDFRTLELLMETGLTIHAPSKETVNRVKKAAQETGDDTRLSFADIEIVALAIDINKDPDNEATILTDDYSIQNIASTLQIKFQVFSQNGITKKFKWVSRCPGCKKQFNEKTIICPVCGTKTKSSVLHKKKL